MSKKRVFEEFNGEIKQEKHHAQILIKIDYVRNSAEGAKKIIEELEIPIIQTKYLAPDWILFELDTRDIRDLALKMSEHGFSHFKGINALPPQKELERRK